MYEWYVTYVYDNSAIVVRQSAADSSNIRSICVMELLS